MDPTTAAMAAAYGYNGTASNGLFSDLNHTNEVKSQIFEYFSNDFFKSPQKFRLAL